MTYLLFCGEHDWTEGGALDLEGAYLTERQAQSAFAESHFDNDWNWANILLVDGLQTKVVKKWAWPWGWRDVK